MSETLTVDDLTFPVRRSSRRKTLEITVDRGGELTIAAPPEVDNGQMVDFVREKRFWLYAKLAEKASREQPIEGKELVSGEGFLPDRHKAGPARVIVLIESEEPPEGRAKRHRPSPRLANQGARLLGDDIAPAFDADDWGALYQ